MAWYVAAAGADDGLLDAFYASVIDSRGLEKALPNCSLPSGVTAQVRQTRDEQFIFVMNFNNTPVEMEFDRPRTDMLTGDTVNGCTTLPAYGVLVLK